MLRNPRISEPQVTGGFTAAIVDLATEGKDQLETRAYAHTSGCLYTQVENINDLDAVLQQSLHRAREAAVAATSGEAQARTGAWSPWLWSAAGLAVLVAAGVVILIRRRV